jgi:large subunit ribosomal protein L33
MFIPNGPWCLPPVNPYATQDSLRARTTRPSHLAVGNDFHYHFVGQGMSRSTLRPVIKLRSTAGTGYTYVTRKSRRNDPDRLVVRKYDPVIGRHVEFREER